MVRKQVFITREQERAIKRRAADAGIAEAEIIRQGIDLALSHGCARDVDWRAALDGFASGTDEFQQLADRVAADKTEEAERWHKRLGNTRRKLAGR